MMHEPFPVNLNAIIVMDFHLQCYKFNINIPIVIKAMNKLEGEMKTIVTYNSLRG